MTPRRRAPARTVLTLLAALAWLVAPPALPAEPLPGDPAALQALAQVQLDAGYDHPEEALQALLQLQQQSAPGQPAWRAFGVAAGLVAAGAGRAEAALQTADALAMQPGRAGAAAAALLRGAVADVAGRGKDSVAELERALAGFARDCTPPTAAATEPLCDWRLVWRARQMLARQWLGQGKSHPAQQQALAAAEQARAQADSGRQSLSLTVAASAADRLGDRAAADALAAQALRLGRADASPALLARLALFETQHREARDDAAGAQRAAEQGLVWARQARSPRLEALLRTNLSDSHLRAGRPRQALAEVARALPVVRRQGDRRAERVLLANAGLARVALREFAAAQRELQVLLADFDAAGARAEQAQLLREFADALAAAGQLPEALKLYHRERQLQAELMAANRDAALAELRARYQAEAQRKQLAQLARDTALINVELDNRRRSQALAAGAVAVGLLASVLVAWALKRVRRVNRQLAQHRDLLRHHAQRDALTGLANRRALLERLAQPTHGGGGPVGGSWLLVDIDHFKRINDEQGHAAGDAVLVEVARRLQAVVRPQDLVVRWGGEEFLIHVPESDTLPARDLAQRVLLVLGGRAMVVPAVPGSDAPPRSLPVTASIGFASFPLAPAGLRLPLEGAVNLVDMALYTAKTRGRNRAVGILALQAADAQALQGLAPDLEDARRSGRLQLDEVPGPVVASHPLPPMPASPAPAGPAPAPSVPA